MSGIDSFSCLRKTQSVNWMNGPRDNRFLSPFTFHSIKEPHMQKDHLEILLEDISGKFSLVLEGNSAIRSEMQEMYDNLNEKIEHSTFLINNKI